MSNARAWRGYSLLELLVALTLLATLFGAFLQVFGDGLQAARSGERMTRAVVIAQSRLAALGVDQALQVGVSSGAVGDGYHWRITAKPYSDDQMPVTHRLLKPWVVTVEVFWEEANLARTVTLTSMLLGPAPP